MADKYLVSPTPLAKPIAVDGDYVVVPQTQKEAGDGRASLSTGFPAETSIPLAEGGKVVRRVDENGFLNLFSRFLYWMQSGGQAIYNASLNYTVNNMVVHNGMFYVCKKDNGPANGGAITPGTNTSYWNTLSGSIGVDTQLTGYLEKPVGFILPFAGNTNPAGYLLCNGGAVSRTTYSALYNKIGTLYGGGNGSTTFNLPNLTNRFIQGSGTSGTYKNAGLPALPDHDHYVRSGKWDTGGGSGGVGSIIKDGYRGLGYTQNQNYINGTGIYGTSNTVQPPALTMRYYIKY